jgi:D-amino peptidase
MRALISADMEGVSGVTCPDDCTLGTPQYHRFQRVFTADVNAVAQGLLASGVHEVLVCDAHGSMRNLLLEQLDPRVRLITGRHKTYLMMEGIQSRPELIAFVGYHAAAGAEGVLSHTMMGPLLVRATLNGVRMSEGLLNAALAQEVGGHVVLVSGDDKTCEDAAGYAPAGQHVAVKQAIDRYTAVCTHPEETAVALREAAMRSVDCRAPLLVEPPYVCDVEFAVTSAAAACALIPQVSRRDDRTVRLRFDTADELHRCFTVLCQVATATAQPIYG